MICKGPVSGHGQSSMTDKWLIIFLLLLQFAGHKKTGASRCMQDIYSSQDGKVVFYDSVVQVPHSELYLIGPHNKLSIVRETPELQKHTVFFPHHFQRGSSIVPRTGSTCTFSWGKSHPNSTVKDAALDSALWQLRTTLMDFLHDPLRNINVAYCAIPESAMQELQDVAPVRVLIHMEPANEGDEKYVLGLPVCLASPGSASPSPSTLPAFASLCCIIRDEAKYLAEWIEYSRMIGVDHFFLYDHNSTDDTVKVRKKEMLNVVLREV